MGATFVRMDYSKTRLLSEDLPLFVHPPVTYANTFDASVGGRMNVLLTAYGQHYQLSEITIGRAPVIDVGWIYYRLGSSESSNHPFAD